ncbi:hypothetical protein PC110_g17706 [Phytophthora cactorum]|nr:hypothetical protein PC112_g22364 [Phytophthora cactorum]KAG2875014.1 hypothetical protein PC114_g24957 [Phytophthora cactorum]KAG3052970.1 hypothetical protein PC122_g22480 [Phytophthora cactorum]RAW25883.1 hypothetical protein PC110_g17706 [Phytophthora cactorum]
MGKLAPERFRDGEIRPARARLGVCASRRRDPDLLQVHGGQHHQGGPVVAHGRVAVGDQERGRRGLLRFGAQAGRHRGSDVQHGSQHVPGSRHREDRVGPAASHGRMQMVLPSVGSFCMVSIGFWCVMKLVVRLDGCVSQNRA